MTNTAVSYHAGLIMTINAYLFGDTFWLRVFGVLMTFSAFNLQGRVNPVVHKNIREPSLFKYIFVAAETIGGLEVFRRRALIGIGPEHRTDGGKPFNYGVRERLDPQVYVFSGALDHRFGKS